MKISKKDKITSSSSSQAANSFDKYSEAVDYIRSAMASLNELAKTDEIAKDAIVNLGVVMFDLRHE